jgi:hypothetical protein
MEEKKPYAVISIEGKGDFHIAKPPFLVYAPALNKLLMEDIVGAGKVIFDACYLGNNGALAEIMIDSILYGSLCVKAAEEIDIYRGELKKN